MSYIVAGIMIASAGMSVRANSEAKSEAKHGARIEGISNEFQKSQMLANSAIISQELNDQFVREEGTADAVATAQMRRGGSVDAISANRKNMLDKKKQQIQTDAEIGSQLLDLDTSSAQRRTSAQNKAGDLQTGIGIANTAAMIYQAGL